MFQYSTQISRVIGLCMYVGGCRSAEVESQWDSFSTCRSRFLLAAQQLPVYSRPGALRRRHTWPDGLCRVKNLKNESYRAKRLIK